MNIQAEEEEQQGPSTNAEWAELAVRGYEAAADTLQGELYRLYRQQARWEQMQEWGRRW